MKHFGRIIRDMKACDVALQEAAEPERAKPPRHVRMFMSRFAPLVEAGTKTTTIRPVPKRAIRAGDLLDLRTWTGKPYRSRQRKLREGVCVRVTPIALDGLRWFIRLGRGHCATLLSLTMADNLARRDGFAHVEEMFTWFESTHGLPFAGVLIEWRATQ